MTADEKKAWEEYCETTRKLEMSYIDMAFTCLEIVCRGHSCSDCLLNPRPMLPCAWATLKDHVDYLRAKEQKEKPKEQPTGSIERRKRNE